MSNAAPLTDTAEARDPRHHVSRRHTIRRRGLAALAVATIGLLAAACYPQESQMESIINNTDRAPAGLRALQPNATLYTKASAWSQNMANRQSLYHSNLADGNPYAWRSLGENVGTFPGNYSMDQANQAFMNSSGHRANIMSTSFNYFAVGVAIDGNGRLWMTQEFMQL